MNHSLIHINPIDIRLNGVVEVYDAKTIIDILNKVEKREVHHHPIRLIRTVKKAQARLISPNFDLKRNKFIINNQRCGICGAKLKYCGIKIVKDANANGFPLEYGHKIGILPAHAVLVWFAENRSELTLDHIIPRSLGGQNSYKNYQVLCKKCNGSVKGCNVSEADWNIYQERCASMKKINKKKILEKINETYSALS